MAAADVPFVPRTGPGDDEGPGQHHCHDASERNDGDHAEPLAPVPATTGQGNGGEGGGLHDDHDHEVVAR